MSTKKIDDRVGIVHQMTMDLSSLIKQHLSKATRTCINCELFIENVELCGKFKVRPPARIIALGCDNHEDTIPF